MLDSVQNGWEQAEGLNRKHNGDNGAPVQTSRLVEHSSNCNG